MSVTVAPFYPLEALAARPTPVPLVAVPKYDNTKPIYPQQSIVPGFKYEPKIERNLGGVDRDDVLDKLRQRNMLITKCIEPQQFAVDLPYASRLSTTESEVSEMSE